jgi:ATP-binding cassette subfamily D (ALD) protein 4
MFRLFDIIRGVDVIRKDNQSSLSEKLFRLNKKFFNYASKLIAIMFPKFLCLSTLLFITLLINLVSLELIIYQVGLLSGKFYKILSDKNLYGFRDLAIISIGMIIANAILKSSSIYISSLLRIIWRKYLTLYLNENYFANKNFYNIQIQTKKNLTTTTPDTSVSQTRLLDNLTVPLRQISSVNVVLDNPDQRITQDVDSMCASMSNIAPIILISPFVIIYYTYKVCFATV